MYRKTKRNHNDESVDSERRGPRCSHCTKAGSDCPCVQHNWKFRIYTGPKLQHVNDDARVAEWIEFLTLGLIAIYNDKRWHSAFALKHTSLTCTLPGISASSTGDVTLDERDARERLYSCLKYVAKTSPNFGTTVLDCQVAADGLRRETTSWVLTRQTGMFAASSDIGQEVMVKYYWRESDGVWKCAGFAGTRGPGAWSSPEFVPIDTSNFLGAEANGSLLQKNEFNFNTGADPIMSAFHTDRADKSVRRHRFVSERDQDNSEVTPDSLGTFRMLLDGFQLSRSTHMLPRSGRRLLRSFLKWTTTIPETEDLTGCYCSCRESPVNRCLEGSISFEDSSNLAFALAAG